MIEVIIKADGGHHPHSLKDPTRIVSFILKHTVGGSERLYFEPRAGLEHCRARFVREKQGRVAFLGGSITKMEGYRPLVRRALTHRFPETAFDFINAGISSTCSTTAAFRLGTDIFHRGQVDLLFVEFAVNDNQDAHHTRAECIRGMEGIVRQARRLNPDTDIVFLYCANQDHIRNCQDGRMPQEIKSHEEVAAAYSVPSVNLAQEIADRIKSGEFDWQKFGGCHPAPFGNGLYGARIEKLFDAVWQAPLQAGPPPTHEFPLTALDAHSYEYGSYLDLKDLVLGESWQLSVPQWQQIPGSKRARFSSIQLLHAEQAGAALTVPFKGTAIGLYVVAGPDAGMVEFTIDGSAAKAIDLYHHYSGGLHYPRTCMLADELANGEHALSLRVAPVSNAKSGGNAVRIVQISVNQPR